jgi:energy-converting hydrogenase Eha subunit E
MHMKSYIEKSLITVDLRSQSCLKIRPERRKKEVKRKLNRELAAISYSPFFLTFSGCLYVKADDILVKPLMVFLFHN